SQGKSVLIQNDEMDVLATLHSKNMTTYAFFDHVDHENKAPSDRANDLSFSWSSIAENIGQVPWFENVSSCGDTRSAEAISSCVVEGWKNSPGHYTNMIGDYSELGVGVAFTKDSIAFFTQVFRNP
ncbi:MAG: CAP domain-containing protein, partial [Flavobacteriales bacterium]